VKLFDFPELQKSVRILLTHLKNWWDESEKLLGLMADKQLPCDTLVKLSDKIDQMLDKAIESMLHKTESDPNYFPLQAVTDMSKEIKRYVFLKVGQVCCKQGNQDKCSKAAKKALMSLKQVRTSAVGVYDQLIINMFNDQPTASSASTPDSELEGVSRYMEGLTNSLPTSPY